MSKTAKDEMLRGEGDAYFERNFLGTSMSVAKGCLLFDEFLENHIGDERKLRVLEIGCCYGYNLQYLCEKYGFEGVGIEPSSKAVSYGNSLIKDKNVDIILVQGTADELPFQSDEFDIVMMGFCMFWVDRKYVMKAVAEVDRVLKTEGMLVTWDFDTRIPFRRKNIHNKNVMTYKCDLAQLFLGNPQYWLMEKRLYIHDECYTKDGKLRVDMQERCAVNILYKDSEESAYIFD